MAPRAITHCLAQFLGDHPTLREATLNHVAQLRGMGEPVDLKKIFDRLETLCRRELQQLPENDERRAFWRAQYGYVRSCLHGMAQGIKQQSPRSNYQVGELVVVPR